MENDLNLLAITSPELGTTQIIGDKVENTDTDKA
jgi:hypothetical protein